MGDVVGVSDGGGWVEGVSEKGGVHWSLIEVCFIGEREIDICEFDMCLSLLWWCWGRVLTFRRGGWCFARLGLPEVIAIVQVELLTGLYVTCGKDFYPSVS